MKLDHRSTKGFIVFELKQRTRQPGEPKGYYVYVCYFNGNIIGMASYQDGCLLSVVVDDTMRRPGVAIALIDHIQTIHGPVTMEPLTREGQHLKKYCKAA